MSSSPQRNPWPPEVDNLPAQPVEENYVSEFLSEKSPEFDAVRRAAADARQETPPVAPRRNAPIVAAPFSSASAAARFGTVRMAPWAWLVAYAGVAAVVVAIVLFQGRPAGVSAPSGATAAEGTATIISRPEGADVFINGERRGVTPLRLTLPVGGYALELRNGAATRALTLSIDAATAVREVVDLTPIASTGRLEVTSDTPGASVAIDGVTRGVTPLVLADVEPGVHRIAISRRGATVYRTVTVQAGATATVVASPAPAAPAGTSGGWLTFDVPLEMQVIENGQVLGTTAADRLMVPAGRRELQLIAAPYGFRTTATVEVEVGRTVTIPVAVPDGRLSINAVPWADVWLNGEALGS
ncbi:MAG: PEGA domain-containing protein, partial [Acidobacteria bacterium]|nr:PEGA domain-containing protein [Acidobacteriota bacterium]